MPVFSHLSELDVITYRYFFDLECLPLTFFVAEKLSALLTEHTQCFTISSYLVYSWSS